MSDNTDQQVTKNTIDIEVLKNTSGDTLRGVNKLCDRIDKDREQNAKSFDNIDKLLRGKDSDNPGLIVKTDRLEGHKKRTDKMLNRIWAFIASLVLAAISLITTTLFGKGH